MKAFSYATARSAEEAVDLVRDGGRFLAGGVDLLGEMKDGLAAPTHVVDVKRLPDLREIAVTAEGGRIGANVTLAKLAEHAELRRVLPGLAQAAEEVGSPQMRNIATVGGNLAQHSRCWYYRQREVTCAKKGGKRCYARGGENKYHSLFTGCMCLSPCTSNLGVALTALGAKVVVQRGRKTVTLTMAELYRAAWETPRAHNSLREDDLILRVEVPVPPGGAAGAASVYLQMGERRAFDWALVSCAAAGRVEGGAWRGVAVALGCVAPVPWRAEAAEKFLEGKAVSEANAEAAAELIMKDAEPREQNGYKVPLAKALVKRALMKLATA
ncbi:MAG TPA: FAD binding domain-containing protein [Opitutus sp.]|nr:FAD binding domain-containing protein [Opitutus sp.]